MSHVASSINEFPREIAYFMVSSFFTVRQIISLHQVSTTWNQIINQVATNAQELMRIRFTAVRLTEESLVEQWGQLTPSEAEALGIKLHGNFPVFYSELRSATILLDIRFLKIKNQNEQLKLMNSLLRDQEKPQLIRFQEAMSVARGKGSSHAVAYVVRWAADKKCLPISKLIEIAKTIPCNADRIGLLLDLTLKTAPSLVDLFKIINELPDILRGSLSFMVSSPIDSRMYITIESKDELFRYLAVTFDWDTQDEKIADCNKFPKIPDEII